MVAARYNLYVVMQLLLTKLADVDAVDDRGWTALHYAAYGGFPKITQLLVKEGIVMFFIVFLLTC